MRYDLSLSFKRMEQVKAEKGYEGPVVVCSVQFTPVAGYVPSRPTIKYLIEQRDMEVWLAPIASTRVVVPFRGGADAARHRRDAGDAVRLGIAAAARRRDRATQGRHAKSQPTSPKPQ